jgi:hypothetical protein
LSFLACRQKTQSACRYFVCVQLGNIRGHSLTCALLFPINFFQ